MKQQLTLMALAMMMGVAIPAAAQRGGKGAGDPESTTFGIQHNAPNAGAKYANYITGVVKKLDKDGIILTKTDSGADETFKFNKKTKFVLDGKDSTIESVHLGDRVWVDMDQDKKSGDLIAHKVVAGILLLPPT